MCVVLGVVGLARPVERAGAVNAPEREVDEGVEEWVMLEMGGGGLEGSLEMADDLNDEEVPLSAQLVEALEDVARPLTAADVFMVPEAAPVEAMEREVPRPREARRVVERPAAADGATASGATTGSRDRRPGGREGGQAGASEGGSGGGSGGGNGRAAGVGRGAGYFPKPPYPAQARSRGQQGTVQLMVVFGNDGRVTNVTVSRSSGYSELDRSAAQWVKRHWRAGTGQVGTFRLPVHFKLR